MTQVYEEALRPLGLHATQLAVLQVLSRVGEISQGELARILAMDSTTLTRTLRIMLREGWVAERRGRDRRERLLRLSRSGTSLLRRALPRWEKVQERLRKRMGAPTWDALLQLTNDVTGTILEGDSE